MRWRIAGISAGLTLLILLCFALLVGRLATNRLKSDFREELQGTANQLAIEGQLGDPRNFFQDTLMSGDGSRAGGRRGRPALSEHARPLLRSVRPHPT